MTKATQPFISDGNGNYRVTRSLTPDEIIQKAKAITSQKLRRGTDALSSPTKVRDFLSVHLAGSEREEFWGIFLDNRHRVITKECLFTGTIDGAAVYPREVIKRVLNHNAAAVIFAHNHPSGVANPSDADHAITKKLVDALRQFDVRVLDHIVVGSDEQTSFAEKGLL